MQVAFFAPLKAPTHPVPSGDRQMARNLMALLGAQGAGVILASELRTRDGSGDAANQRRLVFNPTVEREVQSPRSSAHRTRFPPPRWLRGCEAARTWPPVRLHRHRPQQTHPISWMCYHFFWH